MDVPLPSCIDVAEFTSARLNATEELLDILRQKKGVSKRLFQRLPFEQRRRAQSHNPYRIPRRFRAGVAKDFREFTPLASKRPRRDRRKVKNLRAVFEARSARCRWLETHLWHAKRMHMGEKWGFKLALAPTQKGFRKCYRYSKRRVAIYDRSYYSIAQIEAPMGKLVDLLKVVCQHSFDHSFKLSECSHFGSFILTDKDGNALGPMEYLLIGKPSSQGILLLVCHPLLKESLSNTLAKFGCTNVIFIGTQNVFELYGPLAWSLALRVIKAGGINSYLPHNAIDILKDSSSRVALLNRTKLMSINISIPKILGPFPSMIQHRSETKTETECHDLTLLSDLETWKPADCTSGMDDTSPQSFVMSRRSSKRKLGSKIVAALPRITAPSKERKIERLVVTNETTRPLSMSHTESKIETSVLLAFTMCGNIPKIIMITPRNLAGRQLWTLLHKFGGKPMGLENRIKLYNQQQLLHFPEHWPYTPAGLDYACEQSEIRRCVFERRPPSNRLNHQTLETKFPFGLSWLNLRASGMLLPKMYRDLGSQIINALNNSGETNPIFYNFTLVVACHCEDLKGVPEPDCVISLNGEYNSGFVVDGGHSLESGYGSGLGYCSAGIWLDALRGQRNSRKELIKSKLRPYTTVIQLKPEYLLTQYKLTSLLKIQATLNHINGKIPSWVYVFPYFRC